MGAKRDDDLGAARTLTATRGAAPRAYPELAPGMRVADRYTIERLVGSGGMGTVYVARDQELDRAVALKLHHASHAGDRLRREAIAMAKLAHPNVVTVFEVGELDGRAFVAMEYVSGATLRAWLAVRERTTHEILSALLAAGEGLAAAHAAGLVHRDVKPDNILVGNDGRVRIGDFGLATSPTIADAPVRVPIDARTATGTVVGTPAYMAPEQIEGNSVDARTDQFGFCVAAWEALCGGRPFAGANTEELRASIQRAEVQPPRRRVSAPIRRALSRGMAADPNARWSSMHELLAALRAAARRPRIIAGTAIAVCALTAAIAWAAWPATDPTAACAFAGSEVDTLVPPSIIEAAQRAARSIPRANAEAEAALIATSASAFRARHRALARATCEARVTGKWPNELVAASEECLAYHAQAARELFDVAPAVATQPSDVLQIVSRLPEHAWCGDARRLAGWRSLVSDRAELAGTIAARARLDAAATLVDFHQLAVARTMRDQLAASPLRTRPAVAGRFDLLRGRIALAENALAPAEKLLSDVYYAARASDDGALALEAARELIDLSGRVRRDMVAADRWIRDGLAEAARLETVAPERAAEVYIAAAYLLADTDQPRALELASRAEKLAGSSARKQIAVLDVRANALAAQGKVTESLAILDEIIERQRAQLGPKHPRVAVALASRAATLLEARREPEASASAREAMAILDGAGTDASTVVATALLNLGATQVSLNDLDAATRSLERARAIYVAGHGENHPDVALTDTNLGLVYMDRGETERALAALRNATAIQERLLGPDHEELGAGLFNLAVAERNAKHYDAALATSRRCLDIFAKGKPGSIRHASALTHIALVENLRGNYTEAVAAASSALRLDRIEEDPLAGAWARLEAARGLIGLGRETTRARTLLREARPRYEAEGLTNRVREIDDMLAKLR